MWQAYRMFVPFKLMMVNAGYAFLDVDFRGSTGYGRASGTPTTASGVTGTPTT